MDKYTERIIRWYLQQGKQHKVNAYALGDGRMLLLGPTAGYVIPWDLDISLHITDWTRAVPRIWTYQMRASDRHTTLLPDKAERIMIGFRERVTQTFVNADPDSADVLIRRVMRADLMRASGIRSYAESPVHNVIAYTDNWEPVAVFAQVVRR